LGAGEEEKLFIIQKITTVDVTVLLNATRDREVIFHKQIKMVKDMAGFPRKNST
jgi:hypothetical protein